MKRLLVCLASLGLVASTGFGLTALAAPPSPDNTAGRSNDILGVVPVHNQARPGGGGSSNLSYHGGPVMHTNKVYAIYWEPSGHTNVSGYDSTISQFFGDVAHDNGLTSNVYYSDTQYYDSNNTKILYSSSFGGSTVDNSAFPANGCSDSYTSICLSDGQIRTEIDNVAHAKGWSRSGALFFMFTPMGVGSCYSSSSCAFSQYCAYHSNFNSAFGDGNTLYANMPYADTVPSACDAGQHPEGHDADATINVTSHEHNEAITDSLGSAWFDRRGYENGDKCAWNFGSAIGGSSTSGTLYNQLINGHPYYLQQEWSNASTNCVLTGL